MDEYRYEPLSTDSDRHQIRLLTLLPGEGADELECTISHVSLDQPVYEALSYHWGDASIKAPIWCNYERLMVTQNLLAALYQCRYFDKPRTLWIDAICMYSYRTAMKHLRNLRFMPQFSEGFNSPRSGKIMYYIYFELSFITSFVRERERGYFNLARDERRGNIERAMVEPDRA
jgi:hypothetical protein